MERPILKLQELPYDHPESRYRFQPGPDQPFVATPRAIAVYRLDTIVACLAVLRDLADHHQGLDYLQVFDDPDRPEPLWFIDDGPGGPITALLPPEY